MSLDTPETLNFDASELRFGIVAARYNKSLVDTFLQRTVAALQAAGAAEKNIRLLRASGSNELPYLANMLARGGTVDCVIALGVVIAGDTDHHTVIAISAAHALQAISLKTHIPVINGILVTHSVEQAEARCRGAIDRGTEFARAAVEMAHHKVHLSRTL